jgi:hypothetical protein
MLSQQLGNMQWIAAGLRLMSKHMLAYHTPHPRVYFSGLAARQHFCCTVRGARRTVTQLQLLLKAALVNNTVVLRPRLAAEALPHVLELCELSARCNACFVSDMFARCGKSAWRMCLSDSCVISACCTSASKH